MTSLQEISLLLIFLTIVIKTPLYYLRLRKKKFKEYARSYSKFYAIDEVHNAKSKQRKFFMNVSNVCLFIFWAGMIMALYSFLIQPDNPLHLTN
jgi:hypothetical protein